MGNNIKNTKVEKLIQFIESKKTNKQLAKIFKMKVNHVIKWKAELRSFGINIPVIKGRRKI